MPKEGILCVTVLYTVLQSCAIYIRRDVYWIMDSCFLGGGEGRINNCSDVQMFVLVIIVLTPVIII